MAASIEGHAGCGRVRRLPTAPRRPSLPAPDAVAAVIRPTASICSSCYEPEERRRGVAPAAILHGDPRGRLPRRSGHCGRLPPTTQGRAHHHPRPRADHPRHRPPPRHPPQPRRRRCPRRRRGPQRPRGGGDDYTDLEVLNYALTLEHLEYAFYRDGLERFSGQDFKRGGFGIPAYGRLKTIRAHERTHVETLTGVITDLDGDPAGDTPGYAGAATFRSVAAFLAAVRLLGNTGVAAYDGAAALIVTVGARHAACRDDPNGDRPFPDASDVPLSPEEARRHLLGTARVRGLARTGRGTGLSAASTRSHVPGRETARPDRMAPPSRCRAGRPAP